MQGTGPLVCGPAVAGYSSFAESVSVGDSFYYAVQNADRPQEREVGRGTLQANGTISRQPVQGSLTSFTSGNKTISLVTTSEWFAQVQGAMGQGGAASSVDTRTLLKASDPAKSRALLLLEPGRHGLFVWDAAVPMATHQADPSEGVYVAPNAAAVGAWVRQIEGAVNVRWFGAMPGATAAANTAAFRAALAYLAQGNTQYAWNTGTLARKLHVPAGKYLLNDVLNVHVTLTIEGDGPRSTYLKWAAGSSGFRILRVNTGEYTAPGPSGSGGAADETIIRGMMLEGGHALPPNNGGDDFSLVGNEGPYHGIELRARASIYDVVLQGWQGDGIYSNATAGGGTTEGNANLLRVFNVSALNCRNGIFLDGADTNACAFYGFNGFSCRQWGFWDSSFLANEWSGVHVDGNGFTEQTLVHANGHIYMVLAGQEAWCSANPPSGTTADNLGWGYFRDQGLYYGGAKNWVAGATYRAGGSFCTDNANAFTTIRGYSESGQPPAQVAYPTLVEGGFYAGVNQYASTKYYGGSITPSGVGMAGIAVGGDLGVQLGGIATRDNLSFVGSSKRGYSGPGNMEIWRDSAQGFIQQLPAGSATDWLVLGNDNVLCVPTGTRNVQFYGNLELRTGSLLKRAGGATVIDADGKVVPPVPSIKSGTAYTAELADANGCLRFTSGSAVTFTIPPNSAVAFPIGTVIEFEAAGAGDVTPTAGAGVTINKRGSVTKTAGQFATGFLRKTAADIWTMGGDLA